jgi:RNA polymerase sigma-70 factor, ECF subfamily
VTVSTDDEAAFTELYEQHRRGIHAFLLARTSEPEAARDLLQEVFLRLWRRFGEVAGLEPDRRGAWLYTVARNLVIDRYRSDATRRATIAAIADDAAPPAAGWVDDAVEVVVAREQLAALQDAIAALPDDQRTVLTMSVVGGMTSQQIGDALDLPAGTVRYRLHRARTQLTDHLGGTR